MAKYGNPYQQINLAPAPRPIKSGVAEIIARGGRDLASIVQSGIQNVEKKDQDKANAEALRASLDPDYGKEDISTEYKDGTSTIDKTGTVGLTPKASEIIDDAFNIEKRLDATALKSATESATGMKPGAERDNFIAETTKLNREFNVKPTEDERVVLEQSQWIQKRAGQAAAEATPLIAQRDAEATALRAKAISGGDAKTQEKISQYVREDTRNQLLDDRYKAGIKLTAANRIEDKQETKEAREYKRTRDELKDKNDVAREARTATYRQTMLNKTIEQQKELTRRWNIQEKRIQTKEKAASELADAQFSLTQQKSTTKGADTQEKRFRELNPAQQTAIVGKFTSLQAKQKREKTAAGYDTPKTDEELALQYKINNADDKAASSGFIKALSAVTGYDEGLKRRNTPIEERTKQLSLVGKVLDYLFSPGDSDKVKLEKAQKEMDRVKAEATKQATTDTAVKAHIKDYRNKEKAFTKQQTDEQDALYSTVENNPEYTDNYLVAGEERPMTNQELIARNNTYVSNVMSDPTSTTEQVKAAQAANVIANNVLQAKAEATTNARLKATADQVKVMQKGQLEKELAVLKSSLKKKENIEENSLKIKQIKAEIQARKNAGQWD